METTETSSVPYSISKPYFVALAIILQALTSLDIRLACIITLGCENRISARARVGNIIIAYVQPTHHTSYNIMTMRHHYLSLAVAMVNMVTPAMSAVGSIAACGYYDRK